MKCKKIFENGTITKVISITTKSGRSFTSGKFGLPRLGRMSVLNRTAEAKIFYAHKFLSDEVSTVILSQIKLIDVKRLQYKIGDIAENDFNEMKEKLKQLLA